MDDAWLQVVVPLLVALVPFFRELTRYLKTRNDKSLPSRKEKDDDEDRS